MTERKDPGNRARERLRRLVVGVKLGFRRFRAYCLSRRRTRVLWLLGQRLFDGEVSQTASAMAFDLFLAVIPMLALAGWLFGQTVTANGAAQAALSALLDLTPSEVRTLVWSQFARFSLEAMAPLVLLSALWLASSAFHTSMSMLEMAVSAPPRPWLRKRLLSMAWVIATIGLFGAGAWLSVAIAGGPALVLNKLALEGPVSAARITHLSLLALMLTVGVLLIGAFYRTAVYRGAPKRVWPGVVSACLAGTSISAAFAYYVQNLARFTVFYGGLAAVAIVFGWLYLMCYSFLAGAELNAVLDHEAELADGRHPPRTHRPFTDERTGENGGAPSPGAGDQRAAGASSSGARQTPQPAGSSAEA